MDKRAGLRQFYTDQERRAQESQQFADRTAQLNDLEDTVLRAFKTLIQFMDGKTTKTEVVNQLKSISTPDVDKVVQAVSKLDKDILSNKLDLKPITDALNGLKREVTMLPKNMPSAPEQKESVTVTNLDEIEFDTSSLEAAIKALKLDPKIDVKAPVINVDAPDLAPIKTVMLDVLKAIKDQKYPEIPVTDLKTLETESKKTNKQLEDANKKLQKLVDKPVGGGGGGGGNGTPYQNGAGNASYVTLIDGAVPVTSGGVAAFQVNDIEDAATSYFGFTKTDGEYMIKEVTDTSVYYATISNNGAVTSYTDAWANRATLTYGRFDQAF